MNERQMILLVEDDLPIANLVAGILDSNGYQVFHAGTGGSALLHLSTHHIDLMLLDLGLPDMDGMEVLHRIRSRSDIPVIILSARQDEGEKVAALDAGADDYITKPFGNSELLARIRAALRHYSRAHAGSRANRRFSVGQLEVDYDKRLVYVAGASVHLTPIEFKIMELLSHNAGRVLTHESILEAVWGPYESDNQVLRVNMANIRRKIEENPADPRYILTEIGVGYRMAENQDLD